MSSLGYYNAIPDKDLCAYTLAALLAVQDWEVQTVQSMGQMLTRKGSVGGFFPLFWEQHSISLNGGLTGVILVPTQSDKDNFLAVPSGFEVRVLNGGYDAMAARVQIIEVIGELVNPIFRWQPGNIIATIQDDLTIFNALVEYDIPNPDEFFLIDTPTNTEYSLMNIGAALQTTWSIPQGGGYILGSPAFDNVANKMDLFFCVGGADIGDPTQTMRWMAGEYGHIDGSAFYYFQLDGTTPLRPMNYHRSNFVVFASATNFWIAATNIVAGTQTNIYASLLKPVGSVNSSYFAFDCAPPVGFRTQLYTGNNRGIFHYDGVSDFEPFGLYIPFPRNPAFGEHNKNWAGLYTQCIEAFVIYQKWDGSMINAGLMNNIIVCTRQFDLDISLPFDLAIYRPFTIGYPTTLLCEIDL